MIGIYKFTNRLTGESYIGQSSDIGRRYRNHKYRYDNTDFENTYFHQMLRHYGFDNFDFEVLEECSLNELNEKEMYYISQYNSLYPNGYNKTKGGNEPHTNVLKNLNDVKEIQELLKTSALSNIDIGNMYGVSDQTICDINSGRLWHNDSISYPIRNIIAINTQHYRCKACGKELSDKTKTMLCRDCYDKLVQENSMRNIKTTKDELYKLLLEKPFTQVAKIYGVSDNAVRKWCDAYGIPRHSSYYMNLRKI